MTTSGNDGIDFSPRFVRLSEYLSLPREPQPWVVRKLVPVGGLVNIFGKPKAGKSFVALQLAEAVAAGAYDWEGFEVDLAGPVCYLQVDTPREEWARRATEVRKRVSEADIPLYIADMWLVPRFPFNILDPDKSEIKWLRKWMDEIKPVLVVIDTLREIHNGDEDNSTVMRNVIAEIVGACRPAAIILVSHARKDSIMMAQDEPDLMDQARGSSYVAGRMDVICRISKKRMVFRGRATGQVTEVIEQDPDTGFVSIKRGDDDQKDWDRSIVEMSDKYPGISVHAMAEQLGRRFSVSTSTATRRIKDWQKREEEKVKP